MPSDVPTQQFVHLHNHSEYSLLDGYGHVTDMVARAAQLGQPAMALTDHGNLYAAIDFYKAAQNVGVKPIIGMEGYVAYESRFDKSPHEGARGGSQPHITLLSETNAGYRNLMDLSTRAFLEGHYHRPRVDRELLEELNDGVIVLSGCVSGELARDILKNEGNLSAPIETAGWYREVFGDRYYLELMHHENVPGQEAVNRTLLDLSKQLDIPTVATNDCHYVYPEDAMHQDTLLCIVTNSKLASNKRLRMEDDTYYIRTAAEMQNLFGEVPDALTNTLAIAERCDVQVVSDRVQLPKIEIPDGMTSEDYLRQVCYQGARERFGEVTGEISERLENELRIITQTDFTDYFLVVWDIFKFVKQQGILSAVRGSAASSLVLYCLKVVDFNPLDYGLFFERFLNVERREMPDIDMDFADDRRKEVIGYCLEKYGNDRVAQIGTFGTLLTRSAILDVTRVLEDGSYDHDTLVSARDQLLRIEREYARSLMDAEDDPDAPPRERSLAAIRDTSAEARRLCESDAAAKELLDRAIGVEGRIRNVGTHAAGVVISDQPLVSRSPLQRQPKNSDLDIPSTQYAMEPLEQAGLLKWDFLGLKNLTVLYRCSDLIKQSTGNDVTIYDIPLDDPATFEMMAQGDTFGSFQLEGAGMTRYIKELKPSSILDIASMIALYRPGPMQHIDQFINAKHGRTQISFPHPSLEHILNETYGVIVYQDQVLLAAQEFAGYTLGEADILRKAMGKKVPEIMIEAENDFVNAAIKKGRTETEARDLFTYILPFAGYGFNKAHAVSYAYITYWTTYFKAHYPIHYWAAMLDAFTASPDRTQRTLAAAAQHNVKVLPPDINASGAGFTIDTGDQAPVDATANQHAAGVIRYGLEAIKGVGNVAAQQICEARADQTFSSISDFCNRTAEYSVNEAILRSLVQSGAFDNLASRTQMLEHLPRVAAHIRSIGAAKSSGQSGLFGSDAGEDPLGLGIDLGAPEDNRKLDISEIREWEKSLFGIAITADPMEQQTRAHILNQQGVYIVFASSEQLQTAGARVRCIGKLANINQRRTRDGKTFLSVRLQMLDGEVDAVVWPNVYERTQGVWHEGVHLDVRATVRDFNNELNLDINQAEAYLPLRGGADGTPPDSTTSNATATNGNAAVRHSANGSGPMSDNLSRELAMANGSNNSFLHNGNTADTSPGVTLLFDGTIPPDEQRETLHSVLLALGQHAGNVTVEARLQLTNQTVVMTMPFFSVQPSAELLVDLEAILGEDAVLIDEEALVAA